MKNKFLLGVIMMVLIAFSASPVMAEEKILTESQQAGSTDVNATVSADPGAVTYQISIPDAIDFGTLQQPSDSNAHYKDIEFNVKATEITGIAPGSGQGVAVLMKDGTGDGSNDFRVSGTAANNSGKSLNYQAYGVSADKVATATPISNGTLYPNGYFLTAFTATGNQLTGTLRLDQHQLYMQNLREWAGSYKGTINFFSTVVDINDFL